MGGGELWQDQSNYKTPAKLDKRQKGATMYYARAGQFRSHTPHKADKSLTPPKIVYYICERGTRGRGSIRGKIGRQCVPLI